MKKDRQLTKEEFKRAMIAGLGRAYIQLKTGDKDMYRDVVLYGCLNNFSYDTQANGTAEKYVYSLVNCYDDPFSFLPPLIEKFKSVDFSTVNDWDMLYYARLLTLFALDGASEAAEVIKYKYEQILDILKDPDRTVDSAVDYDQENFTILGTALLNACGKDAYIKIATDLNYLNVNLKIRCYDLPWLIDDLNEKEDFVEYVTENSTEDVSAFLDDYRIASKDIYGSYDDDEEEVVDNDEETDEFRYCDDEEDPDDEAETEPDASLLSVTYEPFYDWASDNEDVRLLDAYPNVGEMISIARERSAAILNKLYGYINKPNSMPFKSLLRYVDHYDKYVSDQARELLSYRTDEDAANYALLRLATKGPEWWTLNALINGYRPENEDMIVYMMNKIRYDIEDEDNWHALVYTVVEAVYDKKIDLPRSILVIAYERSLCRNCRLNLLKALHKKGWLTSEMEVECYYDANEDIVDFAKEYNFKKSQY